MHLKMALPKSRKAFFPARARWGNVARGAAAGTGRSRRGQGAAVGAAGRRSLTERPPTRRPVPVQGTGWLLRQQHSLSARDGWCGCCTGPRAPGVRSRAAADLYAFGQWSAAWSHLARSSRSVGPWALAWLDHASGCSVQCWPQLCGVQLVATCSHLREEPVSS